MSLEVAKSLTHLDVRSRSSTLEERQGGVGVARERHLRPSVYFFLVVSDLTSCSSRRVSPKKREDSPCLPPGPKQNTDRISVSFRSSERS